MVELTFDIETIPDQTPGALEEFVAEAKANFKAPSNMTKGDAVTALGLTEEEAKAHSKESAIAAYVAKFAEEEGVIIGETEWRKTSFDGNRGQLAVIGWKINGYAAKSVCRESPEPSDEKRMLEEFYAQLAEDLKHKSGEALITPKFIGHYIEGFDLPFLFKRSVICGVKPCINLKLSRYSDNIYDTCAQWAGFNGRISLDRLCKVLGVESPKGEIDGSKVWDYVLSGRIAEVATYCEGDVEATYACYQKMNFQTMDLAEVAEESPVTA